MLFLSAFMVWRLYQWLYALRLHKTCYHGHLKQAKPGGHRYCQPKPVWVKKRVIRLKALMPQAGCRTIAHAFNRMHEQKGMTVGKSYVNGIVKAHQYEIQVLRRRIKHKRPKALPHNLIWGVDLAGKTDATGKLHNILGIIEHQSRASLTLTTLTDKASITLLEHLIVAIKRYGKPKYIRTDNEAIFTSRLFRFGLWFLGIRHQRTEVACPWQNGKVERFFGTLKERLNQWEVSSHEELIHSLHLFRFWFNHVRPHDYDVHGCTSAAGAGCTGAALDGRTPSEVWRGRRGNPNRAKWFEAWGGLLSGYYLPP